MTAKEILPNLQMPCRQQVLTALVLLHWILMDDGDLDLFVGGHVMPGTFPKPDRSMLLQNNKGVFTDVTNQYAKDLLNPGIVNQAVWADVDGDGKNELSISGEWMPLEIFSFENGQFVKKLHSVHIISALKKRYAYQHGCIQRLVVQYEGRRFRQ